MNVLDFGSILAATVDVVVAAVDVIVVAVIAAVVLVLADRRSGLVWRFSPEKEQESRGSEQGRKSGKNSRPGARTNLMRDIQKFVVAVVALLQLLKYNFCVYAKRA